LQLLPEEGAYAKRMLVSKRMVRKKRENAPREVKMNKNKKGDKRETRKAIKNTDSQSSDKDETGETSKTSRTAAAYRVSHMKHSPSIDTGLDIFLRERGRKKTNRILIRYRRNHFVN